MMGKNFFTRISPKKIRRSKRNKKSKPPSPVESPPAKLPSPTKSASPAESATVNSPAGGLFGPGSPLQDFESPPFRFGNVGVPRALLEDVNRLAAQDAEEIQRLAATPPRALLPVPALEGAPQAEDEGNGLARFVAPITNRLRLEGAPFATLPTIEKRLNPPSRNFLINLVELPVYDNERVICDHTIGPAPQDRERLGDGILKIDLDLRKSGANDPTVGKTWVSLVSTEPTTRGEVMFVFQTPSYAYAAKHFTSNCGLQDYMLADVHNQGLRADPGMSRHKPRLKRITIKAYSTRELNIALTCMFLKDANAIIQEWYDSNGRFHRGPTSAPYKTNNPNGMVVDHINGQEVVPADPPLNAEEVDQAFPDGLEYGSQPLYYPPP